MNSPMTWQDLLMGVSALLPPMDFAEPQGDERYALWCGSYSAVRGTRAWLPQVWEEQHDTACIDITIERDALERITKVDFEGNSPAETLARMGLVGEAQRIGPCLGPVADVGPRILEFFEMAFEPHEILTAGEGEVRLLRGPDGAPALVLPGGPLRHPRYLGRLGGLDRQRSLAILNLPQGSVRGLVDVVEAARNTLGLDRLDIVAHSAGASLALAYAAAHPEKVGSLALVCPSVSLVAGPGADEPWMEAVLDRRRGEPMFAEAVEASESSKNPWLAQRIRFGQWSDAHAELALEGTYDQAERVEAYNAEAPSVDEIRAGCARLEAPVVMIHGALDPYPSPAQAAALAGLFPHATTVELPAAHYPWLDAPEEFVAAVSGVWPKA